MNAGVTPLAFGACARPRRIAKLAAGRDRERSPEEIWGVRERDSLEP